MKTVFNPLALRILVALSLCSASVNAWDVLEKVDKSNDSRTCDVDEKARLHVPRVKATVTLKDGSRLLGDTRQRNLKVSAAFGKVTVPLSMITNIENTNQDDAVKLVTKAGDIIHGHLVPPVFEINTLIGRQEIDFRHVEGIEFVLSDHSGLGEYLVLGKTRGGLNTEFIKDVPEGVVVGIERVVHRADTMGSVVSRHDSARWLYPVKGEGEAPRVFKEDGRIFYPIWGTWRQRWQTGWEWFDENGTCIRGVEDRGKPHYESMVEYYVVPG